MAWGPVTNTAQKDTFAQHVSALGHQQNLVRGALSRFRSRGFKNAPTDATRVLRVALTTSMLKARAELPESDFERFLDWIVDVVNTTTPELRSQPIRYDFLSGFASKCPRTSLERELLWIAHRIAREASAINAFVSGVSAVQQHCLEGRYDGALAALSDITDAFGQSYWAVQLRVALEHAVGGLEQQKRFTDEVRNQFRRGLLSYITYYSSVRNEDRTTLPRFVEMIEQRIAKTKYDVDVRRYLRYRLFCAWPSSATGIADVLRLEQNHSIIDVYETFIGALQHILTRPEFAEFRPQILRVAALLAPIADFRVSKLR